MRRTINPQILPRHKPGVATKEYAWNIDPAGIRIADNGCNIFDQCRYYIEDREIEHIDHVGVGTLIDGLLTQNTVG